jgi:hypothetical protein
MRYVSAVLLVLCAPAILAQQLAVSPRGATVDVQLSVTPATGYCSYTANITWSAPNASVCLKSGYWSGSTTASGSESMSISSTSATFTLTCSANTDYRDLTWTNPTTNTDNSAVQLTGNKVYHGPASSGIENTTPIVITPAATTYRVSGLPSGIRYFGVKATGQAGVDSAMSNLVSATVALPSGVKTVTVGCTTPPPPKPPTGVTIAETVWEFTIKGQGDDQRYSPGRDVGVIALGTLCLGEKPVIVEEYAEYWGVPRAKVKTYRKPKSSLLLGRCQVQAEG